jgi:hypothetical protein
MGIEQTIVKARLDDTNSSKEAHASANERKNATPNCLGASVSSEGSLVSSAMSDFPGTAIASDWLRVI